MALPVLTDEDVSRFDAVAPLTDDDVARFDAQASPGPSQPLQIAGARGQVPSLGVGALLNRPIPPQTDPAAFATSPFAAEGRESNLEVSQQDATPTQLPSEEMAGRRVLPGVTAGMANAPGAFFNAAAKGTAGAGAYLAQQAGQVMNATGVGPQDVAQRLAFQTPEDVAGVNRIVDEQISHDPAAPGDRLAQLGGSMVPAAAAMVAGGPMAGGMVMSGQMGGEALPEGDQTYADRQANIGAAAGAAMGRLGGWTYEQAVTQFGGPVVKAALAGDGRAIRIIRDAAVVLGGTGVAENVVQNRASNINYRDRIDPRRPLGEGDAEAAALGGVIPFAGMAHEGMSSRSSPPRAQEVSAREIPPLDHENAVSPKSLEIYTPDPRAADFVPGVQDFEIPTDQRPPAPPPVVVPPPPPVVEAPPALSLPTAQRATSPAPAVPGEPPTAAADRGGPVTPPEPTPAASLPPQGDPLSPEFRDRVGTRRQSRENLAREFERTQEPLLNDTRDRTMAEGRRAAAEAGKPGKVRDPLSVEAPVREGGKVKFSKEWVDEQLQQRVEHIVAERDIHYQQRLEEGGSSVNGMFTFRGDALPEELATFLQGRFDRRKHFKQGSRSGWEDAQQILGPEFHDALDFYSKSHEQRVRDEATRGDQDVQWLHALQELPAGNRAATVDTADLKPGMEFKIRGVETKVTRDADGNLWLEDHGDLPPVMLDALGEHVPADRGTFKRGTTDDVAHSPVPPGDSLPVKDEGWEDWARRKLAESEGAREADLSKLTPEQRRNRGSAGSLDPEQLFYRAIIGAAKIKKGAKRFGQWAREMSADFPGMSRNALSAVWKDARRFSKLTDEQRVATYSKRATVSKDTSVLQDVKRVVDRKMIGRAVSDVEALSAKLRAMSKVSREAFKLGEASEANRAATAASSDTSVPLRQAIKGQMGARAAGEKAGTRAGWKSAVEQGNGIRDELLRITRETLPAGEREPMMNRLANAQTLGDLNSAVVKVRNVLADVDVRAAITEAEKLTGTLKLDPIQGPKESAMVGPKNKPAPKLERVDLASLPEPYRADVRKLLTEAGSAKRSMQSAKSIDEKYEGIRRFEDVVERIREKVAEHTAARDTRIGEKVVQREQVVGELVKSIDPKGKADKTTAASNEAPAEKNVIRRFLGRNSLSMSTIADHLAKAGSDAHAVTIRQIRRAQESYHGATKAFTGVMNKAFDAAGYTPHTRKLDDFLNVQSSIDLPNAGKVKMTRNQVVGLMAAAGDPQTMRLIESGIGWNFRSDRLAKPIVFSAEDVAHLDKMLSPAEKKLIDTFKSYNKDNITGPLMDAAITMKGSAPDPHEGYFPRARNTAQNPSEGVPEGWRGHFKEAMENISSLKERAPDLKQPLFVPEFMQDAFKYVDDAARMIHLAEPVRTAAMVWEDPRVKAALSSQYGPSMVRRVEQFLADSMMVRQRPALETYEKLSQALARNVSRSWLQTNPKPMAKNVLGGTAKLVPVFDAPDLLHGVSQMFSKATHKRMLDASPIAWDRYNGGLYGQYSPLTERNVMTSAELNFGEAVKARKLGAAVDALPFMEWADSVPFNAAFAAAEHFVDRTQPGLAPEVRTRAVLDKFHDAVYETQNGSSSTEISGLASKARKNALAQPAMMFTSDANKSYNLLAKAARGGDAKLKAKTTAAVALNALINAGVTGGAAYALTKLGQAITGADPDPEQAGKDWKSFLWNLASNAAGTVYFGDDLVNLFRNATAGRDADTSTPTGKVTTDLINSTVKTLRAVYAYSAAEADSPAEAKSIEAAKKAAADWVTAGSGAAGIPISPWVPMIQRVFKGARGGDAIDPRLADKKAATAERKDSRAALPGHVQQLLAEKNKLDALPAGKLTPAERARKVELKQIENAARRYLDFQGKGQAGPAKYWRDQLDTLSKRELQPAGG